MEIKLNGGLVTLIDDEDWYLVCDYHWIAEQTKTTWYAHANLYDKGTTVRMHRLLLNPPARTPVDHIDRNGLNNQRSNLRIVTYSQNAANGRPHRDSRSKFRGIYQVKETGRWKAQLRTMGKTLCIGSFSNEIQAALAYDREARRVFGEYAYLNFPDGVV